MTPMNQLKVRIALAAVLILLLVVGAEADATYIGFRGDGTGTHPGANPPVQWDGMQESAYRWRCALPTHGYGCPIAVKGKVYAVSENDAEHPYPMLTCIDLKTGRKLWERELNHVPVAVKDQAQVEQIDAVWRKHIKLHGDLNQLLWKFRQAKGKTTEERLALRPDFKALGFVATDEVLLGSTLKRGYSYDLAIAGEPAASLMNTQFGKRDAGYANGQLLKLANLHLDLRRVRCIENLWDSFPTPVSDGERIFIMNAYDAYWCVDLDGNTLWCRWFPRDHGGDDCQNGRSPVIWGGYFIADNRKRVRAFERKTGKLIWEFSKPAHGVGTHEVCSPVVVTVDGEDYVWVNAHPPYVVRCRDGKPFQVAGWQSTGMMTAVNTDRPDTIYMTGGGEHGGYFKKGRGDEKSPAALRLSVDGETMRADVLWMGIQGSSQAANNATIAYREGKLYYTGSCGGLILDPATGKVLDGKVQRRGREGAAVPETAIALLFAQDRVYGFGRTGGGPYRRKDDPLPEDPMATGWCEVYDLSGKWLARNVVRAPNDRNGRNCRWPANGQKLSYPYTFAIAGDCILFRSTWDVTCVGRKDHGKEN